MGIRRTYRLATIIALLAIIGTACSSSGASTGGSSTTTLLGAGSTFAAPLYQTWGATYKADHGTTINYQPVGSGAGIQQLINKTVDFAGSDAPMKPDEETAAGAPVVHIPMAFGAVVVTYNLPSVTQTLKLTGPTVASIFLGDITRWNDPAIAAENAGASLPATTISVAHRADGSGTTKIFTSFLSAVSPRWSSKVGADKTVAWPVGSGGNGNDGVSGLVKQTAGAIGYVELAYANKNNLKFADVKNPAGEFVTPSLTSTTAAAAGAQIPDDLKFSVLNEPAPDAYPICGATWIIAYQHQTKQASGQALVDFLWWGIHQGQSAEGALNYASLPPALVTKVEAKIKTIDFQGTPYTPAT